jgi:hypothetical protein
VFVSASKGSGSACTQASPCATIAAGLAAAASSGKATVYLDNGAYIEQVVLAGNSNSPTITIDGGWVLSNGVWSTCNSVRSGVGSVSDREVVMTGGTWVLKNIEIVNQNAAAPGQTLYGVFATGGSLTVFSGNAPATISVYAGGDGAPAPATTGTGSDGASGGCSPGGGGGGVGGIGAPGSGSYTASGYVQTPGQGGQTGSTGNVGNAGTNNCATSANTCTWSTVDAACNSTSHQVCSTGGLGGCPGMGGPGGAPGGNGGSSIGVFAWGSATVTVQGGVSAAGGGKGQDGAGGNAGGNGVAGAAGSNVYAQTCVKQSPGVCQLQNGTLLTAGPGSTGGNGGSGGKGGGGSGGDAYCYYQGPGASVSVDVCVAGPGGTGGDQGTSPAPSGQSGHYP